MPGAERDPSDRPSRPPLPAASPTNAGEAWGHRYRRLYEAARSFVFSLDRNGILKLITPPVESVAGWPVARWTEQPFTTAVVPEDVPLAQEMFARVLSGESPERFRLRFSTPTGKVRHVDLTVVPDEQEGRVVGLLGIANDVTGRLRVEEEAERLRRQLVGAQRISRTGSWEWDLATGRVLWSDELYRIYGLEPQSCEVTTETFEARVHPDDRERVQAVARQALAQPGPFAIDHRIVRPDGSVRVVESEGDGVLSRDGRVLGLMGSCRDVTEKRERDEALRVYGEIVESMPIGLQVWDLSGPDPPGPRLVTMNRRVEEYGLVREMQGKTLRECMPEMYATPIPAVVAAVADSGRTRIIERLHYGDAVIRPGVYMVKIFPLPRRRVAVAIDDVTQLVRAEEALEEAKEEYRHLLETVQAIVWRGDPHTFRFTFVSREAEAVLGYPVERWLEEPSFWADHLHPDDRDWTLSLCARAAEQRRDHQFEARMIAADGRVVWLRDMVRVTSRDGVARENVGVMIDVTERRKAEEELRRSREQLRDLSAHVEWAREEERTRISREIHDELGQALTALKMDIALLASRVGGERGPASTPEALRERLGAMSALAEDTIDRVRRIAKELRPGVLDDLGLEAALEWMAQDFEARTGTACRVESDLGDARLPRDVATAFFRTFQEALTNVARHAEARLVRATLHQEGDRLILEIGDDGRGISDDAIAGAKSLGLAGMRERARRLGGDFVISAAPGRGTTVTLSVPVPAVVVEAGTR